ncbi:hypothetical protein IQ07DRAFT_153692 [Pyrenochaeta sp. DS3sAY3a]|nr:hypothetical protein IQ07DRAFT_153692 [Pyrenochaeta sp. DS3sAY3a]
MVPLLISFEPKRAMRRSAQACKRCRQQKMKCSGGPTPCHRCARARQECVFDRTSTPTHCLPNNNHHEIQLAQVTSAPAVSQHLLGSGGEEQHSAPNVQQLAVSGIPRSKFSASDNQNTPWESFTSTANQSHNQPMSRICINTDIAHCVKPSRDLGAFLSEAGLQRHEAQEMFALFGERLAPFSPLLYKCDFSTLPENPLYALAAMHAISRYLPASRPLRSRLSKMLRTMLQNLAFQTPSHQSLASYETLLGLVVLYSCCEANGPNEATQENDEQIDMLTVKALTEGYALKMNIMGFNRATREQPHFCLCWLWLYTMSHQCAMVHGCARTIWVTPGLEDAKAYLEQSNSHPRILGLIGEVELCMLWERDCSKTSRNAHTVEQEIRHWRAKWALFTSKAEGRQLLFHLNFTHFQLYTSLVSCDSSKTLYDVLRHIELAQAFLSHTTSASPILRDRLRYMCDFGFVMISYVCFFLLRMYLAEETHGFYGIASLQTVADAAQMMKSFNSNTTSRPAIYGCILQRLYEKRIFGTSNHSHTLMGCVEGSVGHSGPGVDRTTMPSQVSPSTAMSGPSAGTIVRIESSPPLAVTHAFPTTIGGSSEDFFYPFGNNTSVPQSMADLWYLDQAFYSFEDPAFACPI